MGATLARLPAHWMHHALTVLQVGVAVMVVTSVVSNLLPAIWSLADTAPQTVFEVLFEQLEGDAFRSPAAFAVDDVVYLEEHATAIEAASVMRYQLTEVIRVEEHRYAASGVAYVSSSFASVIDLPLTQGRFFTWNEAGGVPRVGVISEEWAQALFGSVDPIGQVINVRPREEAVVLSGFSYRTDFQAVQAALGTDIEIIGVFAREELGWDDGREIHLLLPARKEVQLSNPATFTGERVAIRISDPVEEIYERLLVKVRPGMHEYVEAELQALLMSRLQQRGTVRSEEDAVRVRSVGVVDAKQSAAAWRQSRILAVTGLAALIVAGFAVFATTMASLAHRIQAIGLARSLGATRGRVVREAVTEAGLVVAIGGILGAIAAYPVGQYLLTALRIGVHSVGFTWTHAAVAALVSVLLGVGIGVLAAFYPAWGVARIMPAEALREGSG